MEKTRTFSRGYEFNGVHFAIDVVVDTDTELSSVQITEIKRGGSLAPWFERQSNIGASTVSAALSDLKRLARAYANSFVINTLTDSLAKDGFLEIAGLPLSITKIEDAQGGQDE